MPSVIKVPLGVFMIFTWIDIASSTSRGICLTFPSLYEAALVSEHNNFEINTEHQDCLALSYEVKQSPKRKKRSHAQLLVNSLPNVALG